MRKYEIIGTMQRKGLPTTKFESVIDAQDRSSAIRLVTAQYYTPDGKIFINNVKDLGPVKK